MNEKEELINRFYTAFQQKDYKSMQACYAETATFSDDAFGSLTYSQVCAMWHMLLTSSSDIALSFENVKADSQRGSCQWTANYTFTLTKRRVINKVQTKMKFSGNKIALQTDSFSFWRWARQAFGVPGLVLGWTPFFHNKVQNTARQRLQSFIEKHPEYAHG